MTRAGPVTSGHPGGHDPRVVEQLQQQIAADDARVVAARVAAREGAGPRYD